MNVLSTFSTGNSALGALDALYEQSRDLEPQVIAGLRAIIADDATHARFLNMLSLMEHIGSRKIMLSQAKGELPQDTLKHLAEETRHAFFFKRAAENLAGRSLDYGAADTMAGTEARMYMARLDAFIAKHLRAGTGESDDTLPPPPRHSEVRAGLQPDAVARHLPRERGRNKDDADTDLIPPPFTGEVSAARSAKRTEGGEFANPVPSETAYLYMSLIVELRAIWFYRAYQKVLTETGSRLSLKSVLAEEKMHLGEMWESLSGIDPALARRVEDFSTYEFNRFQKLWGEITTER
jgi:hypothetical protein